MTTTEAHAVKVRKHYAEQGIVYFDDVVSTVVQLLTGTRYADVLFIVCWNQQVTFYHPDSDTIITLAQQNCRIEEHVHGTD